MAPSTPEHGPKRLGDFEIVRELGRGGMGVVYQAVDTKLDRQVAIKVLPESLAGDRDRQERFRREAKVLASLHHPHIAGIYSLDEAEGVHFLVLELVEGETLEERLANGPLAIDEALDVCRQIAHAVEAAHSEGIIHRDLKPANVKVTPDGTVKVLDFGLAKCFENELAASDPRLSPTVTQEGVILGTAAYMSPEQARGKTVDKRTDVWAFGCVLYETLTGRSTFGGNSVSDTIAAVLTREPDWEPLPGETPPAVHRLLRRTLQKDADRRLRDMGDARLEIEESQSEPSLSSSVISPANGPSRQALKRELVPWVIAVVMTLAVLSSVLWGPWVFDSSEPGLHNSDTTVRRFPDRPPVSGSFTIAELELGLQPTVAVSPDGQHLVYVVNRDQQQQLYHRNLAEDFDSKPIPGTQGARNPFFSPDNKWVAFLTRSELKKVSLESGNVISLCKTIPVSSGGCWLSNDTILFTPIPPEGLFRVAADKGSENPWEVAAERVTTPNHEEKEYGHYQPSMLPGGRKFLFTISRMMTGSWDIAIYDMDSQETLVITNGSGGQYDEASGRLVFARDSQIFAVRFDPATGTTTGQEVRIAQGVVTRYTSEFSLSSKTLAYVPGVSVPHRRLVWIDKTGSSTPVPLLPPRAYSTVRLSPDGDRVIAGVKTSVVDGNVLVSRLARGTWDPLHANPLWDVTPAWSPDGRRVIFSSVRFDAELDQIVPPTLALMSLDGNAEEREFLLPPDHPELQGYAQFPTSWSHDGQFVLFTNEHTVTNYDVWQLPMEGDGEPEPFRATSANETGAVFSPDGKWVAYQSDEADGQYEVFVSLFPGPGRPLRVSLAGGTEPMWARAADRLRLYYRQGGQMMVVDSKSEETFDPDVAMPLFEKPDVVSRIITRRIRASYDVDEEGRLLMIERDPRETTTQVNVIVNWAAGIPNNGK